LLDGGHYLAMSIERHLRELFATRAERIRLLQYM